MEQRTSWAGPRSLGGAILLATIFTLTMLPHGQPSTARGQAPVEPTPPPPLAQPLGASGVAPMTPAPPQSQLQANVPVDPDAPPAPQTETVAPPTEPEPLPNRFTLDELIHIAAHNHPGVRSALQQIEVARGRALQVGLYPNPQVAAASPQWAGPSSQYNVFFSQDLVTAGKLRLNVAAASREVDQARLRLTATWYQVVTDIRTQFYVTLAARRRVEVLNELVRISSSSAEAAERLLKAGERSRGDLLVFSIDLDRAKMNLANAYIQLNNAKRQLAVVSGWPQLVIEDLIGDLDGPISSVDMPIDELMATVAAQNAQAQSARVEIGRTQAVRDRAEVEPIPNVNFMFGYQRQISPPNQNQGLFQVMLEVPLFDRNQGNVRSANADVSRALADSRQMELSLAQSAAVAVTNYQTARRQAEMYAGEILPKAREAQQLMMQLYARGESDFLQLLQAQRTLFEVDLNSIDAQQQRWSAAAELGRLLQIEQFP